MTGVIRRLHLFTGFTILGEEVEKVNNKWLNAWLKEEKRAFTGWDFSYIHNRMSGQATDWDYSDFVRKHLRPSHTLLDMGTGGGELLLSLSPPKGRTYATESYLPNYELCRKRLPEHGIDIRHVTADHDLPYADDYFDLVINRHASFDAREVYRVLKPGGLFMTQQVGGRNNIDLTQRLLGEAAERGTDTGFSLESTLLQLDGAGFIIEDGRECFPRRKYYDVGALVYYAKIIEWEFPGFTVERCYENLCLLQEEMNRNGYVESVEHRFLAIASK